MSAAPSTDPFSEMDAAYGAGVVRDPYPTFAKLCREAAVHRGSPHEMF